MEPTITYRMATLEDAPFVAKGVMMALHTDPESEIYPKVAEVCRRDDVLYSWRHALLALAGGQPVGLCLCYDGAGYHDMRVRTFALFEGGNEEMDLEHAEDEAGAGEYYIDSLAVLPEWRRQGIAIDLMRRQLERGRELGLQRATLLVDPDNPSAQELYRRCGFAYERDIYAFGQIFWKWQLKL